ncbi:MAG: aldose 1-epimerase [Niastella sp.]|nr:aldose 1-epimerase [Niastella sp.]
MFKLIHTTEEGIKKIILTDTKAQSSVEVVPAAGAALHAFYICHAGERVNIIEGYKNENDFTENLESLGFRGLKLSPFSGRLKNKCYRFLNKEYTVNSYSLGGHALHGFLYKVPFTVTKTKVQPHSVFVEMEYQYKKEDIGYPFIYSCIVQYCLKKNNRLMITTRIKNKGKEKMPVTDGWHPYFALGSPIDELYLQIDSNKKVELNNELVPSGNIIKNKTFREPTKINQLHLDDCFMVKPEKNKPVCTLTNLNTGLQLQIIPGKGYPFLQIYTPPSRSSIAIENMSAVPNAFNNKMGLIILKPGEKKEFKTSFLVRTL